MLRSKPLPGIEGLNVAPRTEYTGRNKIGENSFIYIQMPNMKDTSVKHLPKILSIFNNNSEELGDLIKLLFCSVLFFFVWVSYG